MPTWLLLVCQFSILALAVLGGVFLAFSDFIMRALRATSGAGGAEAMQAINREVFRHVFMPLFLGMAPVSLTFGVGAHLSVTQPALFVIAAATYIFGVFGITIVRNVPMNNALAAVDPASTDGRQYWTERYLPNWTFWNTIRAAACLLASALLLYGITAPPTV